MASVWQKLGGFVQNVGNLGHSTIDAFAAIGGGWIIPALMNDSSAADNLRKLPDLQNYCRTHGIQVGGWFNGIGGDPQTDADAIATIAHANGLTLIVLDLELWYKAPNEAKMPALLKALRKQLTSADIGVSSYGYADRAMIWNGRTLTPPQSFYDLKIRYLPQAYWSYDGRYSPEWCMEDLKLHGSTDANLADPKGPYGRGVPLSYVHHTGEFTGVEQGDFPEFLRRLRLAKQFGFTFGFSGYVLERTPPTDFAALAQVRGDLYI